MGFKPETMTNKILPALGYNGPRDQKSINAFLAASPAAAAKMGKYTMAARQMVEGRPINAARGASLTPLQKYAAMDGKDKTVAAYNKARRDSGMLGESDDPYRGTAMADSVPVGAGSKSGPSGGGGGSVNTSQNYSIDPVLPPGSLKQIGQDLSGVFNSIGPPQGKYQPNFTHTYEDVQSMLDDGSGGKYAIYPPGLPQPRDIRMDGPYKGMNSAQAGFLQRYGKPYGAMTPEEQKIVAAGGDLAGPGGGYGNPSLGGGQRVGSAQMPSGSLLSAQIGNDPTASVTKAGVVASDGGPNTLLTQGTGQAGTAAQAGLATAPGAATAAQIAAMSPAQYQAYQSQTALQSALQNYLASQGQLGTNSVASAAQMDPFTAAALQLQAAQIAEPQTVDAPNPLQVSQDQLVSGSTVDQTRVDSTIAQNQAASVKTELDTLMQDFQGGNTPSWAAGAMRNASAAMAARGLSASSMAGMAIVQAGMEAALPIAQIDASNKQEIAVINAEQRASFLGMEFDQEFQAKVRNAARISEIANINFTAEQQIALENARMAQTVDLANLDARQGKVLADAATLSQIDLTNLNNRQQANIQNAKSFLQMDLANLSNEQQMQVLKAQETAQAILSDGAAINAASQFNATSQNQTDQFFAGLGSQVQRFNAEQINAINRFNAGETNAISQFNTAQTNARDQFNAQNHLIIAQANAQWAQAITTAANAAANQANRDAALVANNLTATMYNNAIQRERDLLAWAWQSGESERDRITKILEAEIDANGESQSLLETSAGNFVGELVTGAASYIIGKYLPFPK